MNNITNNNIKLISLVGMMGSGKTSCGNELAKKLGISFVDIDSIIELEEDLKISEIFKKKKYRIIIRSYSSDRYRIFAINIFCSKQPV